MLDPVVDTDFIVIARLIQSISAKKKEKMTHSHHHDHSHPHIHHSHNKRILLLSFVLITSYALVEWLGGRYFHSLALMADAGHMLNDSLSLFVALIALYLSPLKQKWLALINGGSLIVVALGILWGGIGTLAKPRANAGWLDVGGCRVGLVGKPVGGVANAQK